MKPLRLAKPGGTPSRLHVADGTVRIYHAGGYLALPEAEACHRILTWLDLLAALEPFAAEACPVDCGPPCAYCIARAAIAKARGA